MTQETYLKYQQYMAYTKYTKNTTISKNIDTITSYQYKLKQIKPQPCICGDKQRQSQATKISSSEKLE